MLTERTRNWTIAVISVVAVGCGGGGGGGEAAGGGEQPEAAAAAPAVVADAATLSVTVDFSGAAPAAKVIDMSEEKVCADKHTGGAHSEDVVVNGGKLQNVFVYVKEGLSGAHAAPAAKVLVDQDGCVYKPHVVGVMTGQTLSFKNSDGVLHNIKAAASVNRPFNISQPTNMESDRSFASAEVMVPVQCDVHGWMHAYVGVLDHPYFAVSGADGTASIGNLPPGTYTVEAWHEKYGTQTQSVTVGPNETKPITFNFSAATATRVPLGQPIVLPHSTHAAAGAGL